ncbi:MAG: histidine--tRNA ligase [Candidatus Zambryskibacteria bacterium CG10_big_fil_rev_8_21_14_0_10_42_12]|uniref:Histidine--tRNA ligase n=1 Tax=Candidatus Zambryskibacteria bacterium CG10_big_fil_rev_8_21_14_0_10_42_12 TaxID=1975115 RepID=A0A2H0QVS8_9BACT|nr:MAG: histidine--tRNA ligase [Candidatus Zambryskibacteria bacterium CG10_big_fil_rev_8_21_14_0_10_42_12]
MTAKNKLGTESYKGVRDFFPEDMRVRNYMFRTIRETVESFGFEEYDASILEPAELYESKTSQEIVNEQTYTFTDRGDRRVTLRPEMTPTVARMVASGRRELGFPLRWYSIPNLFRYERPQRGRLREHYQLNADIFGSNSIEADIEIISLAHKILTNFGAQESDFEIRINNRGALKNALMQNMNDEEAEMELSKMDKGNSELSVKIETSEETRSIIEALKERGISNVRFDQTLVRGFSYYTGTILEVFDTNPDNNRSLFGGGRYDNLTTLFDDEQIPAVGFGMGDVTLRDFLETHGLLPEIFRDPKVFIGTVDIKPKDAQDIAENLRANNIPAEINITDKKIGDQIKLAEKHAATHMIVLGAEELKNEKFTIKNLDTREEQEFSFGAISEQVAFILK